MDAHGAQILTAVTGELCLQGRRHGWTAELLDNGCKKILLVAKVAKEGDLVHTSRGSQCPGGRPGIAFLGKDLGSGLEDALAGIVRPGFRARIMILIIYSLLHLASLPVMQASTYLHYTRSSEVCQGLAEKLLTRLPVYGTMTLLACLASL